MRSSPQWNFEKMVVFVCVWESLALPKRSFRDGCWGRGIIGHCSRRICMATHWTCRWVRSGKMLSPICQITLQAFAKLLSLAQLFEPSESRCNKRPGIFAAYYSTRIIMIIGRPCIVLHIMMFPIAFRFVEFCFFREIQPKIKLKQDFGANDYSIRLEVIFRSWGYHYIRCRDNRENKTWSASCHRCYFQND